MKENTIGNKKIAKNTTFLFIRMLLILCISLYTSRVILSVLGVSDFGVYNVVAGFVSMFAFLNSALSSSIQRYYNYEYGKEQELGFQKVYISSVYLQVAMAIISVIMTEIIGYWYIETKLVIDPDRLVAARYVFHTSVLSMALLIIQVPYISALIAKERLDYYAFVGVLEVVLKLGIVLILHTLSCDKLIVYSFLFLGVSFIDFLLYYVYSKLKIKELKFSKTCDMKLLVAMVKFSAWNSVSCFAQVIKNQGINILLNLFFGPVVNAARGISYQVKGALLGFVMNISTAVRPQIVESYAQDNIERSVNLTYAISKACMIMFMLCAIPVMFEVDFMLRIWLGNNIPEYTNSFVILILLITMVDIMQTPIGIIVQATGKVAKYNYMMAFIEILILPVALIALNLKSSPNMVYILSLLDSLLIQIFVVKIFSSILKRPIKEYLSKVVVPLLPVLILSPIITLLPIYLFEASFIRFILVGLTSIISILVLSYFFSLNSSEKQLVNKLIHSKIKK